MPETIAYFVTPHTGGTFRTFLNLRKALQPFGYRVLAVSIGRMEWNGWWEKRLADSDCLHLHPDVTDLRKAVELLIHWVRREDIRFLIPMSNAVALAALPYLPSSCRIVTRLSSTSKNGVRLAVPLYERISAVVVHAPGHLDYLQQIDPRFTDKAVLVPNGVDTTTFTPPSTYDLSNKSALRILYLGRLSIYDKGIDRLGPIVQSLSLMKANFRFTVVGSGLDEKHVRRELSAFEKIGLVQFHPSVPPDQVPSIMRQHDVLLMPSRFEGFPNTLLEGMACGLVPVVSRLPGITDYIVEDEKSGFVCSQDDPGEFVARLAMLSRDESLRRKMGSNAHQRVKNCFSLEAVGKSYHALFERLSRTPPSFGAEKPLPQRIRYHPLARPRRFASLRRRLRGLLAKWGLWHR